MIVLTGSGECAEQDCRHGLQSRNFCLKSINNNNVATSSKMYFFSTLHQRNPEKEQPWPVLECHWMSSKWPSLALWERSARCLHWWVGTDGFMLMFHSDSSSPRILTRIPNCAFCPPSAPRQDRGALFRALQAPSRRRLSSWCGGVFRTCQIHHRGPGVAACIASRQVLVSGRVVLTCYVEKNQRLALCKTPSFSFCATWKLMSHDPGLWMQCSYTSITLICLSETCSQFVLYQDVNCQKKTTTQNKKII